MRLTRWREEQWEERVDPSNAGDYKCAEICMVVGCEKTENKGEKCREPWSKHDANLKGTKTSKTAFSCTCHPNMKEV